MLGIVLILIFVIYLVFFYPIFTPKSAEKNDERSEEDKDRLKKLWNIAQVSMKEKKTMRAEAALLTILKFDEKNAAAYNRLGILYAREQNYDEAIECFEIAQSLDNNASSLHNVGLIYLETGAYEEASMAFRQALELEDTIPARYIALAKAEEKLGRRKAAVEALESAYQLDHSISTLRQILALHEAAEDDEEIAATTARIEKQIAEDAAKRELDRRAKARKTARTKKRESKIYYPKSRIAKKAKKAPAPTKTTTKATAPRKASTARVARPKPANKPAAKPRKRKLIQ